MNDKQHWIGTGVGPKLTTASISSTTNTATHRRPRQSSEPMSRQQSAQGLGLHGPYGSPMPQPSQLQPCRTMGSRQKQFEYRMSHSINNSCKRLP